MVHGPGLAGDAATSTWSGCVGEPGEGRDPGLDPGRDDVRRLRRAARGRGCCCVRRPARHAGRARPGGRASRQAPAPREAGRDDRRRCACPAGRCQSRQAWPRWCSSPTVSSIRSRAWFNEVDSTNGWGGGWLRWFSSRRRPKNRSEARPGVNSGAPCGTSGRRCCPWGAGPDRPPGRRRQMTGRARAPHESGAHEHGDDLGDRATAAQDRGSGVGGVRRVAHASSSRRRALRPVRQSR